VQQFSRCKFYGDLHAKAKAASFASPKPLHLQIACRNGGSNQGFSLFETSVMMQSVSRSFQNVFATSVRYTRLLTVGLCRLFREEVKKQKRKKAYNVQLPIFKAEGCR
jgi:hypothetical protein